MSGRHPAEDVDREDERTFLDGVVKRLHGASREELYYGLDLLFSHDRPAVLRVLTNFSPTSDIIEDAIQEAAVKLTRTAERKALRAKSHASFRALWIEAARNALRDCLRRRGVRKTTAVDPEAIERLAGSFGYFPEAEEENNALAARLQRALASLDELCKLLVLLTANEVFTLAELPGVLGLKSKEAARKRLVRCRERLRRLLKKSETA